MWKHTWREQAAVELSLTPSSRSLFFTFHLTRVKKRTERFIWRGTQKTFFWDDLQWTRYGVMHTHMHRHGRNYFATPVEVKLEINSNPSLRTIDKALKERKITRKIPVREKSMRRRKIFAFEPIFPSHSVSRFSALSFYERDFFLWENTTL